MHVCLLSSQVLMWPAVISMLVASFMAILLNYEMFVDMYKNGRDAIKVYTYVLP